MAKPVRGSTIYGTEIGETIHGTSDNDTIYGYGGDDFIFGYAGNDTLYGHEGNDELYGGGGDDTLSGQEGNDILLGNDGNDTLWFTGLGSDTLTGGLGADTFVTPLGAWEELAEGEIRPPITALITDFATGVDTLDLSRFDADETTAIGGRGNKVTGNEAFTIVAETDGVTPGHLVITTGVNASGQPVTLVLGYSDTVAGADLVIELSGTTADGQPIIAASDILL